VTLTKNPAIRVSDTAFAHLSRSGTLFLTMRDRFRAEDREASPTTRTGASVNAARENLLRNARFFRQCRGGPAQPCFYSPKDFRE
jgi:hypothetical protein